MPRNWTISEVARLTGVTSRTLRHYDAIALLPPSGVSEGGYRLYDAQALIRLQRILVLRDLGMGLADIAAVLEQERDELDALESLLERLRSESARIERQMTSVRKTIETLREGDELMAEKMFEGWDNSQYKDEVIEKYGQDAWEQSNDWWEGKSADEKRMLEQEAAAITEGWKRLAAINAPVDSDEVKLLTERHIEWLSSIPGTPDDKQYYALCMADMYVEDARFAANYGGREGAEFVRAAVKAYYGVE